MDDFSDDEPRWDVVDTTQGPRAMVIVPYALDTNDMKFWLTPAITPQDWLDYAVETFDRLYAEGAEAPRMMSLGLHLRIIGRPGRIGALERFIAHVQAQGGVWCASRLDIARAFAAAHPAPDGLPASGPLA
jgi:peptidoglycan/xylan/chitin deacetylase (PgdA/CDA1 family)